MIMQGAEDMNQVIGIRQGCFKDVMLPDLMRRVHLIDDDDWLRSAKHFHEVRHPRNQGYIAAQELIERQENQPLRREHRARIQRDSPRTAFRDLFDVLIEILPLTSLIILLHFVIRSARQCLEYRSPNEIAERPLAFCKLLLDLLTVFRIHALHGRGDIGLPLIPLPLLAGR